ncbi:hypothetical protein LTR46_009076 [Exophiala xenobiotica]|nr:hypothetical protein LTR46_009076 [Exophiala xenobiotica]
MKIPNHRPGRPHSLESPEAHNPYEPPEAQAYVNASPDAETQIQSEKRKYVEPHQKSHVTAAVQDNPLLSDVVDDAKLEDYLKSMYNESNYFRCRFGSKWLGEHIK